MKKKVKETIPQEVKQEQKPVELEGIYIKIQDCLYNINKLDQQGYENVLNIFVKIINEYNEMLQHKVAEGDVK